MGSGLGLANWRPQMMKDMLGFPEDVTKHLLIR
jgi:hypothetical protein